MIWQTVYDNPIGGNDECKHCHVKDYHKDNEHIDFVCYIWPTCTIILIKQIILLKGSNSLHRTQCRR